ncbi:hypothetical protein [Nocardia albiluteola]|nr:hypothetical protein [Nocardia albiluteola]
MARVKKDAERRREEMLRATVELIGEMGVSGCVRPISPSNLASARR